ncbi:MAG: CDP-diacylglycerol--glycerol-3-phosphate 3-phosphatidyltransferase [Candidatus Omnitrophica bacterium CG08_land_8_20_14_0_20_41_16]|uniref:CDP-diacylglycerol--glycerol-3-phosphate 3-phosphatidyltransferase n=1 Tax=Candidatus Sherwoodlollariibacterium unditelluris TaxID=1974757 RepID=A0A2G9YHX1_9BACT|nr:MAG: CDP-diacylglycerol--glycerol-3-phosphate 3-phosphatidyltransferase [Candidatus Omnitrophica bacterium CG23_combo_of_CG06-09_8_20_14_all_41_10]PIS34510.1 MAG: CDP-diacylglycerol--glycerol-3-phosphate 3-phosphatidyltransferase [Candidatus Omnitrophica bacterium CG08_land_8_20_14_0_20_41_16]
MNIANKISTFRILSVPFFIASMAYYSQERNFLRFWALSIFILAAVSDAADGYMARKSKQQSKAGLVLDPLGDKLLLMSAFICLTINNALTFKFPLWVTLVVISRDVLIILGTIVIYIVKQNINIVSIKWGKFSTAFQMLAVIAVLLQLKYAFIFWWPAVIFTVLSGVIYINRGFKVLYALDNSRNNY